MPRDGKLKVLVLPVAEMTRASSRVRIHEIKPFLEQAGLEVNILPIHKKGAILRSVRSLAALINQARKHDIVLVQKKLLKLPTTWILSHLGPALAFDFDDALHILHPSIIDKPRELKRHERQIQRFKYLLRQSDLVICGNEYLAGFARQFNSFVEIVPSCIDIEMYRRYRQPKQTNIKHPIVFGWIGHDMNLVDFDHLHDVLRSTFSQLQDKAILRVVSSRPLEISGLNTEFVQWTMDGQFEAMAAFDVGLMPLVKNERSLGRCGYKAIQYMGLGLPVLCSNVGDAARVVVNDKTGIVASTPDDWEKAILALTSSRELRERLGAAGRERAAREYSFQACAPQVASLLQSLVG
jgi:glycosyltransferase involved in cell wall biosynthesis